MLPILDIFAPIINKVLDYIPDPQKKAEAQLKLQEEYNRHQESIVNALSQVDVIQAQVNQADAQSPDKFKSYPRPLALWVCVMGLAWNIVAVVVTQFFVWTGHLAPQIVLLPDYLTGTLLTGLLGLSAYRTYEKQKDLTK